MPMPTIVFSGETATSSAERSKTIKDHLLSEILRIYFLNHAGDAIEQPRAYARLQEYPKAHHKRGPMGSFHKFLNWQNSMTPADNMGIAKIGISISPFPKPNTPSTSTHLHRPRVDRTG